MSNDLFSPNEEVKSFTWETKPKWVNQYSVTMGLSSWSPRLLKALTAHWICSQVFAALLRGPTYFCWHGTLIVRSREKWHPGVSKITSSLLSCLLLFFFFFPAFLLGLLLPCWYEQFIKIVLKEILRCVPSGVGHLLYSTCLNGAEIMRISSCKLETLHIIGVFRYIISFSPWIFVLSETWHSTLPF